MCKLIYNGQQAIESGFGQVDLLDLLKGLRCADDNWQCHVEEKCNNYIKELLCRSTRSGGCQHHTYELERINPLRLDEDTVGFA